MLWEVSTSVEDARKGPWLISQLRGTAKTYMQEQMENGDLSKLFQQGGAFVYAGGSLDATGIQHVVYRLGL
eukprot:4525111-Prorocentrum_lima.AAC.1